MTPTTLTPEITLRIRNLMLDGVSNVEIQELLNIPANTWDSWYYRDTQGFRELCTNTQHERMVRKAKYNLEGSLSSDEEKIRVDVSKFVTERLDKKYFATRTEQTGADGKDLIPNQEDKEKAANAVDDYLNTQVEQTNKQD